MQTGITALYVRGRGFPLKADEWGTGREEGGGRRGEDESLFLRGEVGCWDTGGWLRAVYYFPIKGTEFVHRSSRFWTAVRVREMRAGHGAKIRLILCTRSGGNSRCDPHMRGLENTAKRNQTLQNVNNGFIRGAQTAKKGLVMVGSMNICSEIYSGNSKSSYLISTNKICHFYKMHISHTVLYETILDELC